MGIPSLPLDSHRRGNRLPRPAPILPRIDFAGQAPSVDEPSDLSGSVDALVARVRALGDEELVAIANARRAVDEDFHERALVAGIEALVGRGEEYVHARRSLANAHLLETTDAKGDEIARLVQLAIDDALIAVLTSNAIHPNHLRELYRSLKAAEPSS
jgi:hypothetical protein